MMLLWLGYKQRVPLCEREGEANPVARRAYLSGVPHAFSKSDRSMAVWDGKHRAWCLLVDDSWWPSSFRTRSGALAKGRAVERERDAWAKSASAAESARRTAWLRTPDMLAASDRMDRQWAEDKLAASKTAGSY